MLVSVLLVPVLYAVVRVLMDVAVIGWADNTAREAMLWALYGMSFWTFLFLILQPPTGLYVIGHELTHALFAWLQGVKVIKMELHARGGRIEVERTNWLITLAPYFFPIYMLAILFLYICAVQVVDQRGLRLFWMALLGVSWGFHFTFTIQMLMLEQSDIEREGVLFSASIILTLNIVAVLLWLICVANPSWSWLAEDFWAHLTAWFELLRLDR